MGMVLRFLICGHKDAFCKAWGLSCPCCAPGQLQCRDGRLPDGPTRRFEQVGGRNEELAAGFNDADFCPRVWVAGYRTIFTPYAELYHHEFTSRGREEGNEEKLRRWKR